MEDRISSVILSSVTRPDLGSVNFALYTDGPFILERMDGYNAITDINTVVEPYQLRHGSMVSDDNKIAGKILSFLVHIVGDTESETIRTISRINGILRGGMNLAVVDDGIQFDFNDMKMVASSYKLERESPTYYTLEFAIAGESAYRIRADVFEQVISGGGEVLSGGIIYPLATPYDDSVSYPDYTNGYVTVTQIYDQKIVIDGNGDIYPYFIITGTFYSVKITHINAAGEAKVIELSAIGAVDMNFYHEWWIDSESLEVGYTTPNTYGTPNFTDSPIVNEADWFILNVGENIIKVEFNEGGTGIVKARWQERY